MTKILHVLTALHASRFVTFRAFENEPGWKKDANGNIELKDGNPIYVDANGREMTLGVDTVARLNAEAKNNRERAEKAEGDLKKFEGITDPEAAKKAVDIVGKLDQKKLIDAGEVDQVKAAIAATYEEKLTAANKTIESLSGENANMRLDNAFGNSQFMKDKVAVPPAMMKATFGKNFKFEDGKLVPYDDNGQKIYSKKKMGGEIADFEEALSLIVEGSPFKDSILKGGGSGTGGGGGGGAGNTNARTIRRAEFDAMAPGLQAATAAQAAKGEVNLVD